MKDTALCPFFIFTLIGMFRLGDLFAALGTQALAGAGTGIGIHGSIAMAHIRFSCQAGQGRSSVIITIPCVWMSVGPRRRDGIHEIY